VFIDICIIALLLLMNGFFAMSELALISAKKARLRALAEDGSHGAKIALSIIEDSTAFLSIVQIGMTLNSVLAGAFSGATFTAYFAEPLNQIDWIAPYGEKVAFVLTVVGVTYLNLVVGELFPKRLGLSYAEPIAVRIAPIAQALIRLIAPVVWILKLSTDLVMKICFLKNRRTDQITEDDVKNMIAEGTISGVFAPTEKNMLEGVMRLGDRTVRSIMTPRIDMVWIGDTDPPEEWFEIIKSSGYSRFPVAHGDMDEVRGIVYAKDLLNHSMMGESLDLLSIMRIPLKVPDTTPVLRLLDQFKQAKQHLAIVIDEYGSVEGLVSATDIFEAITGELPEIGQDADEKPFLRQDGSWLIDGMSSIDEVEMLLNLKNMQEDGDFHTLAGFIVQHLGRLPLVGDCFHWNDIRFEVVDMDGHRVDKVLIDKDPKEIETSGV
jgi:putative hemolysin